MPRTLALLAVVLSSLAAALAASFRLPARKPPPQQQQQQPPPQQQPVAARAGALRVSAQLERLHLEEGVAGEAYLQIVVAADGSPDGHRVPVNAVLILDRSGSMAGEKIARARDAARALVAALNGEDRLAIVDFASDAHVLVASTPATEAAKERALAAVDGLSATSGTNFSAALDLAAPQLARGHEAFRVDKVFLASDGQVNEGVVDRPALLRLARADFGAATVSTFGVGEDYDEDLMTALASQAGGRTRFIRSAGELLPAIRAELTRASSVVARDVRLDVRALSGASISRVLGYEADGGWVRLPDFAAGEERRVLVKLALPAGHGTTGLAKVQLEFADAAGAVHRAETSAQATFTADRALLREAPTEAAVAGAKAELAELARDAARAQEEGRTDDARKERERMGRVVAKAAPAAAPAEARAMAAEAEGYMANLGAISSGGGGVASKALKQRAFDAVRAPAKGW